MEHKDDHSIEPGADRDDDDAPAMGWELIAALRGGVPERCDFCDRLYTAERYPVPEEAGLWACIECWNHWEALDAAQLAREASKPS